MGNVNPPWLQDLLEPENYPNNPNEIKLIQTHLSWVFLAGDLVYKVKKPVDFGFLDFTTLEKRRFFCNEEIRLNKRLCPEIYLSVVPITKTASGYRFEGQGDPVEWAVKMKRMPDDGLMSALINRDEVTKKDMDGICALLSPFYKEAKAGEDKLHLGSIDVVRENCEENFEQTKDFVGKAFSKEMFDTIKDYTRTFLSNKKTLFEKRQRDGRIVEGHGDLYSANICFDRKKDKIYIFDCIEFNERFRYGDVAVDVAFLAMDLDFLGLCDLSAYFIKNFSTQTNDEELFELLDFYKCYRAYVRAKIGCFTWASPEVDQKTRDMSLDMAKRYFQLALKYAGGITKRPTLFVFMGLSGSGKSTVAKAFSEKMGIPWFNSDLVRKEHVTGISATEKHLEPFGQGIYSPAFTEKTYRALSRLAGQRLVLGQDAIVDATYIDKDKRKQLSELASACDARLVYIHCTCPDEIAIERMTKRLKSDKAVSDGRKEIFEKQKAIFNPPSQEEASLVVRLDTDAPVEQILQNLEAKVLNA